MWYRIGSFFVFIWKSFFLHHCNGEYKIGSCFKIPVRFHILVENCFSSILFLGRIQLFSKFFAFFVAQYNPCANLLNWFGYLSVSYPYSMRSLFCEDLFHFVGVSNVSFFLRLHFPLRLGETDSVSCFNSMTPGLRIRRQNIRFRLLASKIFRLRPFQSFRLPTERE